jgi:hypothetical protein
VGLKKNRHEDILSHGDRSTVLRSNEMNLYPVAISNVRGARSAGTSTNSVAVELPSEC